MRATLTHIAVCLVAAAVMIAGVSGDAYAKKKKKRKKAEDPYAEYVWPAPPDEPRIKLDQIIYGRADVAAKGRFRRRLLSASPQAVYDTLGKPHAVDFDSQGRVLVTDAKSAAILRFDREGRRMDVFGTRGAWTLKLPLGLDVSPTDTIFVADAGLHRVVAFDPEGGIEAVYGSVEDLVNPTDAAISPDGTRLFVADSKAHRIVVFAVQTAEVEFAFGSRGPGDGEFNFPTSLAFDAEGNLLVVDQLNFRVQQFTSEGEYMDQFGGAGAGFGSFTRPKDIAVDDVGFIYVTDNAFNNVQIFDVDFTLLTFVGEAGRGPGRFYGASGVGVRGDEFAVVDQHGRRVQIFRFIVPKDQ